MNYATLSPETRKAYIETCEGMLKEELHYCDTCDCTNCPAYPADEIYTCVTIRGGSWSGGQEAVKRILAYFERTLKELRAMDAKMTKQQAQDIIDNNLEDIKFHESRIKEMQAIIDAPEVDPRVGKLFWHLSGGENTIFQVERITDNDDFIALGSIALRDRRACRPVTREEALAMVYEPEAEKSCKNCGDACSYYGLNYPRWIPKP